MTHHSATESIPADATLALLLRAALIEDASALETFAAWKQAAGFVEYSDVDFLATYLLPCVYTNFSRMTLADPWLAQLAGLHRYHLAKNAARKRTLLKLLERMTAGRLPFLLSGGFGLLTGQYFSDLGERPFLDAELILAPADGLPTRQVLESLGWHATTALTPVAGWRSESWRGPDGQMLQIHFRWLPRPYPVVGIHHLLRHARSADFSGLAVHIPDATDLLLSTCVGGWRVQGDRARQFLWVADAIRILQRSKNELDWNRLWCDSRSLGVLHPVCGALAYLRATFQMTVDDARLAATRPVKIMSAGMGPYEDRLDSENGSAAGKSRRRRPWDGYLVAEQAAGRMPSASGMLRYLGWRISLRLRKAAGFAPAPRPVALNIPIAVE
jgi:hypothetical protein